MLLRKPASVTALTEGERSAIERLPISLQTMAERRDAVRTGDRPTRCCLVVNGWVYRYRSLDQGDHQILAFYVPGDIPDLESLHIDVADQPLAIMARTTIGFIAHEEIQALIDNFPGIARAF